MIHFERSKISAYWKTFSAAFNFRRHAGRLDSIENIEDFAVTRAAFIAQKGLFGYVKTRMGTKYPEMFRDDLMVQSLNIAKMHVYAACLSDLTIWIVANASVSVTFHDSHRCALAERIFTTGLDQNNDPSVTEFSPADKISAFKTRLGEIEWSGNATTRDIFTESPAAVIKWAPISDTLKRYDVESVTNSIKFSWNNIRSQFISRLDIEALGVEVETKNRLNSL